MKTELELTLLVLLVSCSNDNFDFMHLHETELQNVKGPIVQSSSYETYYWSMGEKIPLTIDSSKCYVVVDELTYEKLKTNLSKDEKLTDFLLKDVASKGVIGNELYNEKYYSGVINTDLLSNENYIYKQYTYKEYNGESVGVTDEILVKLKDKADILILEKLSNELGYMIVDDKHPVKNWVKLQLDIESPSDISVINIANYLYETGLFEEVTPNVLIQLHKTEVINDPYYWQQWALVDRVTPIYDINFEPTLTHARPYFNEIVVAVLDDGVDPTHPDLNIYSSSFDAHSRRSPAVLSNGTHGTSVAGIIGAKINDIGIVGVAANIKIMPISFRFREDYYNAYTSVDDIAYAIIRAEELGADVFNCSFNASSLGGREVVIDAFNQVMTTGRDGKGCVVVFGAGNNNSEITNVYSINLPNAITVGSINTNGTKSSYSAYGTHLDIVAPGVSIYSTDLGGGYSDNHTGTSFATPHVTGVAALILAKKRDLTRENVVEYILSSASKIPTYTFTNVRGKAYTFNEYVGYGLLDAFMALSTTPYPPYPPY